MVDTIWQNPLSPELTNMHQDGAWMVVRRGLRVRSFQHARNLSATASCPRGCSGDKTVVNLLMDCPFAQKVFVFDVGGKDWKYYDWSKVTTIAAFGPYDPELLCYAHANQVRVVLRGVPTYKDIMDRNHQRKWINHRVNSVKRQFMDGINLDLKFSAENNSAIKLLITDLVAETTKKFYILIPGSQVTFNVPWSPDCIDGRCYDFLRIANSCDFLFVMSYDMQSQMWDICFSKPNAPYYQTLSGYSAYINLGIDSRKLVLGVPWYGYDYTCRQLFEGGRCVLEKIASRGAPCSGAAGRQVPYKEIVQHVHKSITGRYWDDEQKAPYYIYMVNNTYHLVWYDDPQSISIKSAIMKKLRLRGIGMWNGNMLNYNDDHFIVKQTEDMWNALCPFNFQSLPAVSCTIMNQGISCDDADCSIPSDLDIPTLSTSHHIREGLQQMLGRTATGNATHLALLTTEVTRRGVVVIPGQQLKT
ncbi:di-N-acetylchitobiase-like [Heptranchias perlo]|uniref:di-N-acetylchitobiase-like n=1 Tax=Heptranchias perlo TaxID=212740 RepID=UPI003559844E